MGDVLKHFKLEQIHQKIRRFFKALLIQNMNRQWSLQISLITPNDHDPINQKTKKIVFDYKTNTCINIHSFCEDTLIKYKHFSYFND